MLQEKEILFDEPDELKNNFEYLNNINPAHTLARDSSKSVIKSNLLNLNEPIQQENNQQKLVDKSFLSHHPTISSCLEQSKQDLVLAQHLNEAEKVYLDF